MTNDEIIKLLKKKQKIEKEIKELEHKKKDLNFVVETERRVDASNAAKQEANKKYKQSLKIIQKLESEIDLILETDQYKPRKINIPSFKHSGSEGIANLCLADWHCEETVNPEEVMGYNKFNIKIAEERARKAIDVAFRLIEIERYAMSINKLVLYLLGDFLSGYIHEELMISNSITPAEAILFLEDILYSMISKLSSDKKFAVIDVICHPGNHSRYTNGRFIHHKGQAKKTFEWILYHNLAKTFNRVGNTRVNFIIPHGNIYVNREFKYPIRSQHGHNFKYAGGIGGAYIPINKKILRWNQKEQAYLDVFGHLHQFDAPRNYIQCGSLIGYNQYAQDCGYEYEPPKQALFFIEKKRGLVSTRPIYVG